MTKQYLKELLEIAAGVKCNHPKEFQYEFMREHDNGYGRQTKLPTIKCRKCRCINFWPTVSNNWTKPEDIAHDVF